MTFHLINKGIFFPNESLFHKGSFLLKPLRKSGCSTGKVGLQLIILRGIVEQHFTVYKENLNICLPNFIFPQIFSK